LSPSGTTLLCELNDPLVGISALVTASASGHYRDRKGPRTHGHLYPALTYRHVKAALAWLETEGGLEPRIFDADGAGAINHAAVLHGDGMVLIESERPEELHGSHTGRGGVYIAVGDPDAHYQRAKAAGVAVLNAPHDALNGDRFFKR
jgi:uncharacterized glyoxalase superfamily protein PhnB